MLMLHELPFLVVQFCTLWGGKGGGGSAPDYRGAAQEQSAASKEIATQQTWANRPELTTPWGTQTWSTTAGTDPATGQPVNQWSSDITLTPDQQAALDDQMAIQSGRSEAAKTLLGQATSAFQTPFNWEGLPKTPGSIGEAQQGAFEKMSAMLEPGRSREKLALETRLANMGLPNSSEAYGTEMERLGDKNTREDLSLMAAALSEGRADTAAQQGLRTAGIAEEAQRRGMTLNELNALLTGQQVNMPQMPNVPGASAGQAPNLLGAAQAAGQYGLGQQQLAQSGGTDWGSAVGGIATVAAIAM